RAGDMALRVPMTSAKRCFRYSEAMRTQTPTTPPSCCSDASPAHNPVGSIPWPHNPGAISADRREHRPHPLTAGDRLETPVFAECVDQQHAAPAQFVRSRMDDARRGTTDIVDVDRHSARSKFEADVTDA